MDSAILVRIKKLLALASNNPSKEEAAVAAAKAAELMADHKLEMSALDGVNIDPEAVKVGEAFVSLGAGLWIGWLSVSVGKAFHAKPIKTRKNGHSALVFIGKRDDVAASIEMMRWLVSQIKSMAVRYARENGAKGKTVTHSFCVGAANVVSRRLNEAFAKRTAENPRYGALVVVDDKAISTYVAEKWGRLRTSNARTSTRDYAAYNAGRVAGENVSLNQRAVASPHPALT
jgi:hypothetical protein